MQSENESTVRCGLCCTARHIVKVCHDADVRQQQQLIDLLVGRQLKLKEITFVVFENVNNQCFEIVCSIYVRNLMLFTVSNIFKSDLDIYQN